MTLTNLRPSLMSWRGLPSAPLGIDGILRRIITTASTTNPIPDMRRADSVLKTSMRTPAIAGAMIRVPCQMTEFIATALIITLRSMRWG